MIRKITLNRFKKFKNSTVELAPFSVLTGENSCGKTTVLQAIHLALRTLAESDLLYEKNEKLQVKSKGVGATEFPGIPIEDFRELYYEKSSRQARTSNVEGIGAFLNLEDNKGNIYKLQISSLFGGFNIRCLSSDEDIANHPEIYQYRPLLILGGKGIARKEARRFPADLRQKIASGNQGEVIRNQVLELKTSNLNGYRSLAKCLAREFGFSLDKVAFEEKEDFNVQAMYRDCYGGNQLSLDYNSCGSGHLQILQILVPIYLQCPHGCKVVLLDEPELHLHPSMQVKLLRILQKIQREMNIQMIVATQSETIVNKVSTEHIIPISSVYQVNKPLQKLNDASAVISNWALAQAVISGKIVYMNETPSNVWEMIDSVAGTKVFGGMHTVPIVSCVSNEKDLFQIREQLAKSVGREITLYYVKGNGGYTIEQREQWKATMEQSGVRPYLLEEYEIENYFMSSKLLLRTMDVLYPQMNKPEQCEVNELIRISLRDAMTQDNIHEEIALQDYMRYGSGKKAFAVLFQWLKTEWDRELCLDDILNTLEYQDIPNEILNLLVELKSTWDVNWEHEVMIQEETLEEEEPVRERSLTGGIQLTLPF